MFSKRERAIKFYENLPWRVKELEPKCRVKKIGEDYFRQSSMFGTGCRGNLLNLVEWKKINIEEFNRRVTNSAIALVERSSGEKISNPDKYLVGKIARKAMWETINYLEGRRENGFNVDWTSCAPRNELIVQGLQEYGFDTSASIFDR